MAKVNVHFGGELAQKGAERLATEGARCALRLFFGGILVVKSAWIDVFVAQC